MANYKVNQKSKTVILDMDNITDNEMRIAEAYISKGYLLKEKKKGLTYEDMKKGLKGKENLLKELEKKITDKEKYMNIKSWYNKQIKK